MNNKKIYISSCCPEGGIYSYKLVDGVLTDEVFNPCKNPMYTIYNDNKLYVLLRDPFDKSDDIYCLCKQRRIPYRYK